VVIVFKGEKTTVFWIGLVSLGYSIFQFFQAFWVSIYNSTVYPIGTTYYVTHLYIGLFIRELVEYIPNIIAGIIFLVIGLYLMKVGVKKETTENLELPIT
jgi:putative Mn2+ efflux pump MntP